DGTWHALSCARSGGRLSMSIDGEPVGSVDVPPSLSIANAEPLRVGGKGASAGNDQFAGQLDDIELIIG
ncbi:MAG TPA: LamG-like jellyroll fold domain-containing protein, partial [Actinoplanes sp.]|nr:LamG-like jellyroll fold domain-containing protein [Actinoplanes sp.]